MTIQLKFRPHIWCFLARAFGILPLIFAYTLSSVSMAMPARAPEVNVSKRLVFIGLSGAGKTTTINTFTDALRGGTCQFIIPVVVGPNELYPKPDDLLTEGIYKTIYRERVCSVDEQARRIDLGQSDTHKITGYIVQRTGNPTYELIDTPGLNDNSGAAQGQYYQFNDEIYNAVRDEIVRSQQHGQPIDAIVFVLAPLPGRSGYRAQDADHPDRVVDNSLLGQGVQRLIELFPQDLVNTNFFFICNKQKSEADTVRMKREVRTVLPGALDDRFIEVGVYDAISAHQAQRLTDEDYCLMDDDAREEFEDAELGYQEVLPTFKTLDGAIASLEKPLNTLDYIEYLNIYEKLANLVVTYLHNNRSITEAQDKKAHEVLNMELHSALSDGHKTRMNTTVQVAGGFLYNPKRHPHERLQNMELDIIHDGKACGGGPLALQKTEEGHYSSEVCGTIGQRLRFSHGKVDGKSVVTEIQCDACNWRKKIAWDNKYYQKPVDGFPFFVRNTSPKVYTHQLERDHGCILQERLVGETQTYQMKLEEMQLKDRVENRIDLEEKKLAEDCSARCTEHQKKRDAISASLAQLEKSLDQDLPAEAKRLIQQLNKYPKYFNPNERGQVLDKVTELTRRKFTQTEYAQEDITAAISTLIGVNLSDVCLKGQ